MKTPIFLFSLPRSGSTLLQRVLMSHHAIASVAEPWIMLPLVYINKQEGVLTEYSHQVSFKAVEDFISNLPRKEDDYYETLKKFTDTLYSMQCKENELYFLDKTPRYYYIITEILKIYPNAKFIFLFRNPLHIMSSMVQTWGKGRFKRMYVFNRDLTEGSQLLIDGYNKVKDKSYALKYEDFVKNPKKHIIELCNYLEIQFDEGMLTSFSTQDTKGRAGDPTGINEYKKIETNSIEKWKSTFNTSIRKRYIKQYILSVDSQVLKLQGYDKNKILDEIDNIHCQNDSLGELRDILDIFYGKLIVKFNLNLLFGRHLKGWTKGKLLS